LTSAGGYATATYSNIAVTGGSGTGMIITMSGVASGYLGSATVTNPGTGYRNGDTITIPAGNPVGSLGGSFVLGNYNAAYSSGNGLANYTFGIDGNLILPGNLTIAGVGSIRYANGVNYASTVTGTYSNTDVAAYLTTGVTTANLTVAGNVVQQSAYYETYSNIANSGGNLTCNFNLGTVFYAALTANVTANFTNVNAIASTVTGATIIVDQGATAYRVANVQVNGVNQTIRWVGAAIGAGTASNTDVVSFSLIHLGSDTYRVLGQVSNYG
jgi:hypothetical protein